MTETPKTKAKPKTSIDIDCPACGSVAGTLCRRRPAGLHYKAAQQKPCYARSKAFLRAHGLGRSYRKGAPRFG